MLEAIEKNIVAGNFQNTKKLIDLSEDSADLYDLIGMAFDTGLAPYSTAMYLITKKPNDSLHDIAGKILSVALCHIEGAYQVALFHAQKALEMNPESIERKRWLLYFYEIPERVLPKE